MAMTLGSMLHQLRRETELVREQSARVIDLASEHRFVLWSAWGAVLLGWALVAKIHAEEAIGLMRQGLKAWRDTGAEVARPWMLGLLADAHERIGQPEEGLGVVADALATVDRTGERQYEAELYRLKGELLLKSTKVDGGDEGSGIQAAENCLLKAIKIARRQEAKSLELRSLTSLGRLWLHHGRKQQARKLLAEAYGWFTEGFDTLELKEAKLLLEELDA
jgi:adenylate cyclase